MVETSRNLKSDSAKKLVSRYFVLAILRVILVLLPQTGYIHPDEYFQTTDVLAGKIFHVQNDPPWEFNRTSPIRSMAVPYFSIGICYIVLREIGNFLRGFLALDIINTYFLLVLPRLLMCIMSFVVDYCLYKICANNNEKYKTRLIIQGSCYVTLVYGTRTFSNTFELFFFALLLYFVCESQTFSNMLSKKKDYINYRYEVSKTVVEKAKFHKLRLYLIADSYRNCFIISTITVLGFFNRPTFLAFAVMPIFFWIYRGIGSKSVTVVQFHTRIIFFALCSLPAFVFVIVVDSFHYGYISWGEIGMWDVSINSFVFTPLNFLKYNIDSSNLAKHGLHPRWLHTFVNIPLLFTVLGIYALLHTFKYANSIFKSKFTELPNIRSIKCLMTVSSIVPVVLLSIFPHQEPRFLIPLLLPLVYLYGMDIFPEPDNILMKILEGSLQDKQNNNNFKNKITSFNFLLSSWLIINVVSTIFFGFLHQGGIYSATSFLQRDLSLIPREIEYHIVSSHIYSLPEAFLLEKLPNIPLNESDFNVKHSKRLYLHEEGSFLKIHELIRKIKKIGSNSRPVKKIRIYLLLPNSLDKILRNESQINQLDLSKIDVFYPHLSLEALPSIEQYFHEITTCSIEDCTQRSIYEIVVEFLELFGLALYEVDF